MKIELPWGEELLKLHLPPGWNVLTPRIAESNEPPAQDELAVVQNALSRPALAVPLADQALAGKNVLIIVDDNTRPTPVQRFFHLVLEELQTAAAASIRVLPALGIHSPMSEAEMAAKIGAENLAKVRWQNHDAFNADAVQSFGTTSRGTPVELNRAVAAADIIILIGLVEPHLWAGFGGGLKNILPGVASADCIGRHHAIIAEPPYQFNRVGMDPDKNSFRRDLEEVQQMITAPIFCLNVATDPGGRIIAAFAGDPVAAHRQGVEFSRRISGRPLPARVDAIIVNSHPMDINFKQSMKAVANSLPALKPGGTIMGFLRAARGLDDITPPEDSKPLWLVKRILRLLGPSRVLWFLEKVRPGLNVEEKFLIYYSMQLIRGYELYFHVPSLSAQQVRQLSFFTNFDRPQQVIDQAAARLKKNASVAVFPEAGITFPIIDKQ